VSETSGTTHLHIFKYPRTYHIEGSGLQQGESASSVFPFTVLHNRPLVIEEKMDGANCGISFGSDGQLLLQSRGHYLVGGPREQQFTLLKSWANRFRHELWSILRDRYIMYGEWVYAKHTIFYTDLPHYFLEFDIYDTQTGMFFSTPRRCAFLSEAPFVASVRVLHARTVPSHAALAALIGPSPFIAQDHLDQLRVHCVKQGIDAERAEKETDASAFMEGLYIKIEEGGVVTERYKLVRAGFLQTVLDSDSHWMNRPIVPNLLRHGTRIV
jgi:hypothetical protein